MSSPSVQGNSAPDWGKVPGEETDENENVKVAPKQAKLADVISSDTLNRTETNLPTERAERKGAIESFPDTTTLPKPGAHASNDPLGSPIGANQWLAGEFAAVIIALMEVAAHIARNGVLANKAAVLGIEASVAAGKDAAAEAKAAKQAEAMRYIEQGVASIVTGAIQLGTAGYITTKMNQASKKPAADDQPDTTNPSATGARSRANSTVQQPKEQPQVDVNDAPLDSPQGHKTEIAQDRKAQTEQNNDTHAAETRATEKKELEKQKELSTDNSNEIMRANLIGQGLGSVANGLGQIGAAPFTIMEGNHQANSQIAQAYAQAMDKFVQAYMSDVSSMNQLVDSILQLVQKLSSEHAQSLRFRTA